MTYLEFGRKDLVVATAYLDFAAVIRCETDPVGVGFNPLAWIGIAKKRYSGPALQWVRVGDGLLDYLAI